jgi:hypothetical protein
MMTGRYSEAQNEAIFRQDDMEITITLDDANQIRAALLNALKTSQLTEKKILIAMLEPLPAWIDSDGRVMIGGWLLQLRNSQLVASYRISTNDERAIGYTAQIDKEGNNWRVIRIVPEKVRFVR